MPGLTQARLAEFALARSELRAVAKLFEASVSVQRDIHRRAANNGHSKVLRQEAVEYGRLADRVGAAYIAALHDYRVAVFKSAVENNKKSVSSTTAKGLADHYSSE